MKNGINFCLLIIILSLLICIVVKSKKEGFRGGGFAVHRGGSGGMRAFGPSSMGGPKPVSPGGPMGGPIPPSAMPPSPMGPRHPYPRPARGYGGVGWAQAGIPAYRYFNDYPLAYSYSYANDLRTCNNGCCDFNQCRLGNGCKFTSNDIKYMGDNPVSCIIHKYCVYKNVDKLDIAELEKKCAKQSNSNIVYN
jgi:hypothetical protein